MVVASALLVRKLADLNGDGFLDMVMRSGTGSNWNISYALGKENFEFEDYQEIASVASDGFFQIPTIQIAQNNLHLYDFDLDGDLDIIYVDGFETPNQIKWIENTTPGTSVADVGSDLEVVTIGPNPVENELMIFVDGKILLNHTYQILDSSGAMIKIGYTANGIISLNELSSGTYIIQTNKTKIVKSFLKK